MSIPTSPPAPNLGRLPDRIGVYRHSGLEISTVATDSDVVTLELDGELDLRNAELVSAVVTSITRFGNRSARLDVSRLDFCDCAGLRAIVLAHNELLSRGAVLLLVAPTPRLIRLLRITHLDEALIIDGEFGSSRACG